MSRFPPFSPASRWRSSSARPSRRSRSRKTGPAPADPPPAAAEAPAAVDPNAVVATVDGMEITEADLALAAEDRPAAAGHERRATPRGAGGLPRRPELSAPPRRPRPGSTTPRTSPAGSRTSAGSCCSTPCSSRRSRPPSPRRPRRALYEETVADIEPQQEVRARHILVPTEGGGAGGRLADRRRRGLRGRGGRAVAGPRLRRAGRRPRVLSPGTAWSPPSPKRPSRSSRGRCPGRCRASSAGTSSRSRSAATAPPPSFEDMRDQIETFLARRAQQELILSLRQGATIDGRRRVRSRAAVSRPRRRARGLPCAPRRGWANSPPIPGRLRSAEL